MNPKRMLGHSAWAAPYMEYEGEEYEGRNEAPYLPLEGQGWRRIPWTAMLAAVALGGAAIALLLTLNPLAIAIAIFLCWVGLRKLA